MLASESPVVRAAGLSGFTVCDDRKDGWQLA